MLRWGDSVTAIVSTFLKLRQVSAVEKHRGRLYTKRKVIRARHLPGEWSQSTGLRPGSLTKKDGALWLLGVLLQFPKWWLLPSGGPQLLF